MSTKPGASRAGLCTGVKGAEKGINWLRERNIKFLSRLFLRGGGHPPQERNYAMLYYLIVCRSLTYAQRTAAALERAGITARVLRSPKSIAGEGCSHSVKISQRNLPDALRILQRVGLTPKRIYITAGDGSYQEVAL
jgi:hypothetical protein